MRRLSTGQILANRRHGLTRAYARCTSGDAGIQEKGARLFFMGKVQNCAAEGDFAQVNPEGLLSGAWFDILSENKISHPCERMKGKRFK